MKFKLIMESWRKVIKENYDPVEIVGALAEDFGYTLHTAPAWMSALVDTKPYVIVFNAFSERKYFMNGNIEDILSIYKDNTDKKVEELLPKFDEFIKLAQSELDVKLSKNILFCPITDWVKIEDNENPAFPLGPMAKQNYYDETIDALVMPREKEIMERIHHEYKFGISLMEEDFDDFIFELPRAVMERAGRFGNKQGTENIIKQKKDLPRIYRHIAQKAFGLSR